MRCAFVPPKPKDERPATTLSPAIFVTSTGIVEGTSSRSMLGLSFWKCRFAGAWRLGSMQHTFSMPAMPAAPSKWPMLLFTAASTSGSEASRPLPRVFFRAPTSMGSPRPVPVPWVSETAIAFGARPASESAVMI
eukprot:2353459-Heterocapsa_arctica.AAC.1